MEDKREVDSNWKVQAINLTHKLIFKTQEPQLSVTQKTDNFHFLLSLLETTKLFEENQQDTKTNEESKKIIYDAKIKDIRMKYSQHLVSSLKSEELRKDLPLEKQKTTFKLDLDDLKTNAILSTIFTQRSVEGPLLEVDEVEIQKLIDSQRSTEDSQDFDFDLIEEEAIRKQDLKKKPKEMAIIEEEPKLGFISGAQYQVILFYILKIKKQLNSKNNKNSYSNSYPSSSSTTFDPAKSVVTHMTGNTSIQNGKSKKRKFKVPFKKDENEMKEQEEEPEIK